MWCGVESQHLFLWYTFHDNTVFLNASIWSIVQFYKGHPKQVIWNIIFFQRLSTYYVSFSQGSLIRTFELKLVFSLYWQEKQRITVLTCWVCCIKLVFHQNFSIDTVLAEIALITCILESDICYFFSFLKKLAYESFMTLQPVKSPLRKILKNKGNITIKH